ncbi:MAG: Non-specific serine/threonine protein kinase [Cyanobacteriota bacterium erpe_2018_sw_39hr_WHONDRS-SW48-000098_B_bin.30]|nr:Non-specific serine/threonine protein kinase [Cyanobacteriota bacterium erpe_2018_sw_39hr_WHONDRS-SW48-000098_B_bin.30]
MWKPAEKLATPKLTELVAQDDDAVGVEQQQPAQNQDTLAQADAQPLTQSLEAPIDNPKDKPIESTETPPQLGERYQVLGLVGSGGMGTVWKVFDKELNETFAIKVLNPDLVADETANKRFQKEAKLASELTHANIAAIFGPGTDTHGRPYIIMRYVDGESLADILKREGKLSEERALDIFKQICEALSHSHMKGIIHRDIKPSNIIISKTESGGDLVQIVDFGIARYIYEEVTKTQALTKAVDIFGSPMYMSPEQFLGEEITAQSDIYSLGCVLYEMLTGTPPFTDENPVKLVLKHLSEPPDLSKVPAGCKNLLSRCLGKDKKLRAVSIDDLIYSSHSLLAQKVPYPNTDLVATVFPVYLSTFVDSFYIIPAFSPASMLMFLIWTFVFITNRSTAANSNAHKRLEYNLFIITLLSIASIPAFALPAPIRYFLAFPVLPALALWCSIEPRFRLCYERLCNQLWITQPLHLTHRAKLAATAAGYLTWTTAAFLSFAGFNTLYSLWGSAYFDSGTFVQFTFALLLMMFAMLFLHPDKIGSGPRRGTELLKKQIPKMLLTFLATGIAALPFSFYEFQTGQALLTRQRVRLFDGKTIIALATEALNYPDTVNGNLAKLQAARRITNQIGDKTLANQLSDQILGSNCKLEPQVISTAYLLKLVAKDSNKTATSADIDNALNALENLPQKLFEAPLSETSGGEMPIYLHADTIGNIALRRIDVERAEKALALLKRFKNKAYEADNLQDQILWMKKIQDATKASQQSKP